MITATGLTKRYGTTAAVDDLSFEVKPGIVTGFLGPNGAGKTTTMRLILGLDKASAGSITVDGRDDPVVTNAVPPETREFALERFTTHTWIIEEAKLLQEGTDSTSNTCISFTH